MKKNNFLLLIVIYFMLAGPGIAVGVQEEKMGDPALVKERVQQGLEKQGLPTERELELEEAKLDKDFEALQEAEVELATESEAVLAVPANPVELNGDVIEYLPEEGKFLAKGNVVIRQNDAILYCDEIKFSRNTQEAWATGNVALSSDQGIVWAKEAYYNFQTKKGEFTDARIMADPVFGEATSIMKVNDGYYVMSKGYVTTSDYDNPEWRVRANKIEVYPGDKAIARQSTMLLGGVPIMYIPKYVQDLRDDRPHVQVTPGYSKDDGAYVLTTYRVYPTDHIGLAYHLDYREKKDLGWGIDLEYSPEGLGQGVLKTYYMNERTINASRIWDERATPTSERERYRVEWRHKWKIDPTTIFMAQYYKLSDASFLKDYFENEYRDDATPATYFLLTKSLALGSLSMRVDTRPNRFVGGVERLPELAYNLNNHRLGDTGLYFKSQNSLVNLVDKPASPTSTDYRTWRFHTDNQVSRPFKTGIFVVNPYVGTEQTYYSRALSDQDDNTIRGLFKTGWTASTKFYRIYDVEGNVFGLELNKLRHVMTPILSYDYMRGPTQESAKFHRFDAIDDRSRSHAFTFSLENKFQTKDKNDKSRDIFRSLFSTSFPVENADSGMWGDVKLENDLYWNSYVTFHNDMTYDNATNRVTVSNFDVYLKDKSERWHLNMSRRYAKDDDDILTGELSYVFSPKWKAVVYQRWDAFSGQHQEQQYSLIRDLHSWEVELTFRDKESAVDSGAEFWIVFRLKAFPSVRLDGGASFNQSRPGAQQ